jgi:DNA-binding CsgD family transcriptional regulator
MPGDDPDAILDTVGGTRLQLAYEAELAYLRGDFERMMQCYHKTEGDDALRLRICPVAFGASISLGDYHAYTEIDAYLKGLSEKYKGSEAAVFAEVAFATVAVSVIAPNMVPEWLKSGDLSALPPEAKPDALYLRAKYLHCVSQLDAMLAVTETALTLSSPKGGITVPDLYLRLTCAVALYALNRKDEAKRYLLEAMRIALPFGFITPFAELITAFGGLMEQCLELSFPGCYDAVLKQWKSTWKNWITFHNNFTKDNITLILSLREYHIAVLVARRVPYAKIAQQYCISVGRLKNIMLEIYSKLFISGRDDLVKYVF